jgi:hypothetical protein
MPKKRTVCVQQPPPERWFVKELAGEIAPSFETMRRLYALSSELYGLRPWRILDEDHLVAVRGRADGELRYCSVIGALGEVLAMHAYIGTEGLRQFRKMSAGLVADPGEFLASTHCVYVEFVPKADLLRQDREFLAAMGHPQGRGLASPIFRAMRPGFHPWFVAEDEAQTLAECIRATIVVCAAVLARDRVAYWEKADAMPLVQWAEGDEPRYDIEIVHAPLPPEPPAAPAQLPETTLSALRGRDYAVGGAMELDISYSGVSIGKKGERNSCAAVAIAVDAESGMVLAPEIANASDPAGDTLAAAFAKAIQTSRRLPKEVKVRDPKFKESLVPLMESFGVKLRVAKRLPAAEQALAGLLEFMR